MIRKLLDARDRAVLAAYAELEGVEPDSDGAYWWACNAALQHISSRESRITPEDVRDFLPAVPHDGLCRDWRWDTAHRAADAALHQWGLAGHCCLRA